MKNNYHLTLILILVTFSLLGQTRNLNSNIENKTVVNKSTQLLRQASNPVETVTSCGSYTWNVTGETYTTSGTYTSNGITQNFNNTNDWNTSVSNYNVTVVSNSLAGLAATNPINLSIGATNLTFSAPNGTYTTSTFVSTNHATDQLIINFSPAIYGFSANIFASNASDNVVTGDVVVTYSTGFIDTRTVSTISEFFGYTSTTPITSVTIGCVNTGSPFKYISINNIAIATNPNAILNLTVENPPITSNYSVCQGETVNGGMSASSNGLNPVTNFSGNNTGGPTYNRPLAMNQGGICGNSGVGNAVQYVAHTFTAPTNGDYSFSTCGGATFDTFLALYESPFDPAGLCAGNTLIESSDDFCGSQSNVTATLVEGTNYTLVVSGFSNTDSGSYIVTSTNPSMGETVEWYTAASGGSMIGTGSPFNPVGVTGSSLTNTNTTGTTTFYAQFAGETCRTPANFTINPSVMISCPSNITTCEGEVVNFTVSSNFTLTQNTSSIPSTGAGIGCNPGGDNTYYRIYDLNALGMTSDIQLNSINFSAESSSIERVATVNAYTLSGEMSNANLTLLGSTTVNIITTPLTNYTANMGNLLVPGGSKLVVSYSIPASTNNPFIPGSNTVGQSSPVYIKALACGINEPMTLASLGFPNVHVILDAVLLQQNTIVQTAGLPSGSVFPVGINTLSFEVTNASGCSNSCSFDIIVNSSPAPTGDAIQSITVSNPDEATLADLIVSPTNVEWYSTLNDAQNANNPLPLTTVLVNGSTYYAVNINNFCPSSPMSVTVSVTLGTTEFDFADFVFYPNPTNGIINFKSSEILTEIKVFNLLGQVLKTQLSNSNEVQIDLTDIPESTYLIKVLSVNKEKTIKVVKK